MSSSSSNSTVSWQSSVQSYCDVARPSTQITSTSNWFESSSYSESDHLRWQALDYYDFLFSFSSSTSWCLPLQSETVREGATDISEPLMGHLNISDYMKFDIFYLE